MITLRDEQRSPCDKAKEILSKYKLVYIAGEIRTGKTPISLVTAYESGWRKVCVLTKKNAIPGFEKFHPEVMFDRIDITNYENVHKLKSEYDGYIIDEAHNLGAFPIPSKRTKRIKELIGVKPVILLSGTPTPEGYSQIYHQLWISWYGPFSRYKPASSKATGSGFYSWSKDFVKQYEYIDDEGITRYRVKQKFVYGNTINDYSEAKEAEVKQAIHPYFVQLTQKEAGFTSFVEEEIIMVKINSNMYKLMKVLKKDKYYKMKTTGDEITVDTSVRLQSLFHQLSSGTLNIGYIEDGKKKQKKFTLDESKAWFIKSRFAGHKMAIFYKFVQEGVILKNIFPNHTNDQNVFNSNNEDIVFICQMVSGREGVNISSADSVIMYNIDFSATTYWQIRGRMQERNRVKASKLYWIFSEHGIERKIYRAVSNKFDYTLSYFKKDLKAWDFPNDGGQTTIENNK